MDRFTANKQITLSNIVDTAVIEGEVVNEEENLFGLDKAILNAFEAFLQIDVANGDATADTVAGYRREVAAWVRWCHEFGIDPARARRFDVEAYREALKASGMAVATRKHKLSIIRRFYAAAQKYALIQHNPAEGVRGGKDLTAPEEKIQFLAEQALSALLAQIPLDSLAGARDRALVALLAIHGLRRIEVHRLNHESLQLEGDLAYLMVVGKGNKQRRVYLREDTYECLQTYAQAKFNAGYALKGAIFVGHGNNGRGGRISRQSINEIVDKYLSRAALKRSGVSCHALRHTFGTLSVAGGAKVEHVRDAMGHSKLETTSLYVKAVERAKNNPANFINVSV
jgi:site-specific recombinase XerD